MLFIQSGGQAPAENSKSKIMAPSPGLHALPDLTTGCQCFQKGAPSLGVNGEPAVDDEDV